MYGGQCTEGFYRSSLQLIEELVANGFEYTWFTLTNDSLITRARDVCAAEFLASDYSHMMFIDADIEFKPEDVGKLWAMQQEFAVGVYPMKKPGAKYAAWRGDELVTDLDQYGEKAIVVDYAGTGFMLISRYVFEKLRNDCPEIQEYEEGQVGKAWSFFQDPIDNGIHLSEDYFFCHMWRIYGGDIWMDPTVRLKHIGTHTYDGT